MPKEDQCPECDKSGLEYEEENNVTPDDVELHMSVKCPKCDWEGREVYNLGFERYETD